MESVGYALGNDHPTHRAFVRNRCIEDYGLGPVLVGVVYERDQVTVVLSLGARTGCERRLAAPSSGPEFVAGGGPGLVVIFDDPFEEQRFWGD